MPYGIYLHIPFCVSKCSYCDFFSVIGKESFIPDYVAALCSEIELYADPALEVDTVFFGGGTPSMVEPEHLSQILEKLRDCFSINQNTEVTCETNPETVNQAKLEGFRNAGINRLSLGVQSFHNSELSIMGRVHSSRRAVDCFYEARAAGFQNISIDLISALPGMSLSSWMDNLNQLVVLSPDHLSAYTLEYHPGTKFERERTEGRLLPAQEKLERSMYLKTIEFLVSSGYEHYEISNFARPGFQCRHNTKYWKHESYLGFGTSAHGFDGKMRYWNHSNLERYLADLSIPQRPVKNSEHLDDDQLAIERLMLGLRTSSGIQWESSSLPTPLPEHLIERDGNRLRLTTEGYALYDSVCDVLAGVL